MHDPCSGMGQGHDRGTQYRSGIYCTTAAQRAAAAACAAAFQAALGAGAPAVTTELPAAPIDLAADWFYAEPYHQQYLARLPAQHTLRFLLLIYAISAADRCPPLWCSIGCAAAFHKLCVRCRPGRESHGGACACWRVAWWF